MVRSTTSLRAYKCNGFTLIECLVVLSILGLLAAILVPAVMSARESSRGLQCSNNLKQIALGMASYESACGALPGTMGVYSPFARILPFIDQYALFNSINFNAHRVSTTLLRTEIAIFLCPSDPSPWSRAGGTNYALNAGTMGLENAPFSWNPETRRKPPQLGYQRIVDGLSTTALATEWLTGVPYRVRDTQRSVFQTNTAIIDPTGFPSFLVACRNLDAMTATINGIWKGKSWARPDFGETLYNHALLPGEHSCTNGTLALQGAWTASSSHGGAINVAFADGHVKRAKTSMSRSYWTAIGTMNGQEVVPDAY